MKLNRELAKEKGLIAVKNYESLPERVLQFGEGNFLRAFTVWMVDEMNRQGLFNGRVAVAQPIEQGLVEMLATQDCLYTLYLRGVQKGQVYNEHRVVSAISRGINPYTEYALFLKAAHNPDLRFIISNTTEAGIVFTPEERIEGKCPVSFPAKLTSLMYERFKHFNAKADKGFVIIPCELIEHNGKKLKEAVLQYAALWKLGDDFIKWIQEANAFLSTLVDRVVSGYPRDEAEALEHELGYKDNLIDVGEYFHLLVIEGDNRYAKELPFTEAGLNVIWTDDMTPYRSRKVKILNGAHTTASLAGYLAGLETVREYTDDPVLGRYLEKAVYGELVPTVDLPDEERKEYAAAVIERFKNPFVKHYCLSIALNSVSKYKVRVLPSLEELTTKNGCVPPVLSFALAALIVFYRITERSGEKAYGTTADGRKYPIQDDLDILNSFEAYWTKDKENIPLLVQNVLSNIHFWGKNLTTLPGLSKAVSSSIQSILNNGMSKAVKEII